MQLTSHQADDILGAHSFSHLEERGPMVYGAETYGKSSLSVAPSQGLRRCLNILERHQEQDDLLDTLADSLKCLADLVTYGVLGKAERPCDLAILHPVAAAH